VFLSRSTSPTCQPVEDHLVSLFCSLSSDVPTNTRILGYHIHVAPVPASGNCTGTLAHLDPFIRGEDPKCDPKLPETCQVGDLSGKHGKIPESASSVSFSSSYLDLYASTEEGIGAFLGNRSFVVHFANKTRITCASFKLASSNSTVILPTGTGSPSSGSPGSGGPSVGGPTYGLPGNTPTPTRPAQPVFTNAAAGLVTSMFAVLGAAFAALLL
jgi:hypothetical protein